jgi:hypothetical protein
MPTPEARASYINTAGASFELVFAPEVPAEEAFARPPRLRLSTTRKKEWLDTFHEH